MNFKNCKQLSVISICIFLVSLLTSCGLFPKEEEVLAPPLIEPEQVTYSTEEAVRGYMENSVAVTGYFIPVISEKHFFRFKSGRIKEIHIKLGDTLKKGDLIAELLTDSLESDILYQELAVSSKLNSLENSKKIAQFDMKASEDKLAALKDRLDSMKKSPDSYSSSEIQQLEKDMNIQKLALEKMKLNNQSQFELKNNDLQIGRLRLESMKRELEKSRLYAGIEGIVSYLTQAEEGDYVDAYTTIATVSDLNKLQIEYRGREASSFRLGMQVEVVIDDKAYGGEVVMTPSDVPFEEYEKYKETIRFNIGEIPEEIKKGDSARIKMILETRENALMVPRKAVRLHRGNKIVYVLEDGLRVEKYVDTGLEQGSMVEITDGLVEGEKVIVE